MNAARREEGEGRRPEEHWPLWVGDLVNDLLWQYNDRHLQDRYSLSSADLQRRWGSENEPPARRLFEQAYRCLTDPIKERAVNSLLVKLGVPAGLIEEFRRQSGFFTDNNTDEETLLTDGDVAEARDDAINYPGASYEVFMDETDLSLFCALFHSAAINLDLTEDQYLRMILANQNFERPVLADGQAVPGLLTVPVELPVSPQLTVRAGHYFAVLADNQLKLVLDPASHRRLSYLITNLVTDQDRVAVFFCDR